MKFFGDLERRVQDEGARQDFAAQRNSYEKMQRDEWFQIVGAAVLLLAFVGGAVWRWRASRIRPAESGPAAGPYCD